MAFITDDLGRDYPRLLSNVRSFGDTVKSRIGETKEILNFRLELDRPERCVVSRKGMSRKFMDEEILQLLAGTYVNKRLYDINVHASQLITAATAYGPRTWQQLESVEQELTRSNSRRGVVYVGRPTDLTGIGGETAGEMPCTETWQFHVRDGKIHMSVTMRSWDLVWGLSYDIPSFVSIQMALADSLGLELGTYVHTAGSGHIYDKHYELEAREVPNNPLDISHLLHGSIRETRENARSLLSS